MSRTIFLYGIAFEIHDPLRSSLCYRILLNMSSGAACVYLIGISYRFLPRAWFQWQGGCCAFLPLPCPSFFFDFVLNYLMSLQFIASRCGFRCWFVCLFVFLLLCWPDEDWNPGRGDCGHPLRQVVMLKVRLRMFFVLWRLDERSFSAWRKSKSWSWQSLQKRNFEPVASGHTLVSGTEP